MSGPAEHEHPEVRRGWRLVRELLPKLPDAGARRKAAGLIAVLERLGAEVREEDEPWTPLRQGTVPEDQPHADLYHATYEGQAQVWLNETWQVIALPISFEDVGGPEWMLYLSIKRRDRRAVHDWRALQRIKNQLAGEEAEAVELYPAESRLRDEANQYHLWCLPPGERFPFGFDEGRHVGEAPGADMSRQRPWPTEGEAVPEEVKEERDGGG